MIPDVEPGRVAYPEGTRVQYCVGVCISVALIEQGLRLPLGAVAGVTRVPHSQEAFGHVGVRVIGKHGHDIPHPRIPQRPPRERGSVPLDGVPLRIKDVFVVEESWGSHDSFRGRHGAAVMPAAEKLLLLLWWGAHAGVILGLFARSA